MRRIRPAAALLVAVVLAALIQAGGPPPTAGVEATPDRSEVVLVLDFSASILADGPNRGRFGAALERIADRVDETSADLAAGDATVSIVQFATRAVDYDDCTDMRLLDSPPTVARFADCLRSVAGAYRRGLDPALTASIGIDTNYVAAMERAATHLPQDAVRPTLILFTDGKHDVDGVPVARVQPARDRLFGDRTPFALLPVGMGLEAAERDDLTAGLERLQTIRDMPACVSGTAFDWPQVVFETADEAGTAVAVALQNATCTFTVAPPTPVPPTPVPTIGAVRDIQLTAGDGRIDLAWVPPAEPAEPVIDYRVRCSAEDGDWVESTEGQSSEPRAAVEGLANGTPYRCEVALVTATSEGDWTPASTTVTPLGLPPAPGQPSVVAADGALEISVAPHDQAVVSEYRYECSSDSGATWPVQVDAPSGSTTTRIRDLANGVDYVCRAFAANAVGVSDASPLSDAVRPCGSAIECNPLLPPLLVILGVVLAAGVLMVLVALYRDRTTGYVLAVMDTVHTANLGHGSKLGIGLVRAPGSRQVTDIVADRRPTADFRIRVLSGGRFEVRDKVGRHIMESGDSIVAVDSVGIRHQLVLHAFDTRAASSVASRR